MSKIIDEQKALDVDPFDGDWGDDSYTQLSNKIVTIKKARPCDYCKLSIEVGDRARVMTSAYDGTIMRHTFCADCLNLMVKMDGGDDGAIFKLDERSRKGWEKYEAKKSS